MHQSDSLKQSYLSFMCRDEVIFQSNFNVSVVLFELGYICVRNLI